MLRIPGQEMSSYIAGKRSLYQRVMGALRTWTILLSFLGIYFRVYKMKGLSQMSYELFSKFSSTSYLYKVVPTIVSHSVIKKSATFRDSPFKFESQLIRDLGKPEYL